jgi:hypothetical protein
MSGIQIIVTVVEVIALAIAATGAVLARRWARESADYAEVAVVALARTQKAVAARHGIDIDGLSTNEAQDVILACLDPNSLK